MQKKLKSYLIIKRDNHIDTIKLINQINHLEILMQNGIDKLPIIAPIPIVFGSTSLNKSSSDFYLYCNAETIRAKHLYKKY